MAKAKTKEATTSVYGAGPKSQAIEQHTMTIIVDNEPGVLARVAGLISGRGYNIESLTVAETNKADKIARITIVVTGTPIVIEQIHHQIERLVPVYKVVNLTVSGDHVSRELGLFKVVSTGEKRIEALRIAEIFGAKVVDSTLESFIFELTGKTDKIDAFIELMRPLGLENLSRSGSCAMMRGKIVL